MAFFPDLPKALSLVSSLALLLLPLRAAQESTITVDPQTVLSTVDSRLYGVNLVMWDDLLTDPTTQSLLSDLRQGSFRFPGGSLSNDYDWSTNKQVSTSPNWTWANGVSNFNKVCEARGGQPYICVNYGCGTPEQAAAWVAYTNGDPSNTLVLGVDSMGRDWKTVGYWASMRASAPLSSDDGRNFLRVSHPAPYGFKNWELGNENYGSWERDVHGVAGSGLEGSAHDPVTYAKAYKVFSALMHAVDPSLRLGAVSMSFPDEYPAAVSVTNPVDGTSHKGWTPVMLATMKSLGIVPQSLSFHYYAQNPGSESDAFLLSASAKIKEQAVSMRKMLGDYLGTAEAAGIELAMTELNSVSYDPGKQTANLVNALFYADCYGTLAGTEFKACTWWDLHNSSDSTKNNSSALYGWRLFGCYDMIAGRNFPGVAMHAPLPTYYAAKLMTHWARGGDRTLSCSSSSTLLASYAVRLADGRLALLVINKSPDTDFAANLALGSFIPGSDTASVWSYGKANDAQNSAAPDIVYSTLVKGASSFRANFPSYSATVLVFAAPTGAPAIQVQPLSRTAAAGSLVTLKVTATGSPAPSYQWLKNGVVIPGAVSATLPLGPLSAADAATYVVTVSNAFGTVSSTRAIVSLGSGVRLSNVSMRSATGTGSSMPTVGFVVSGSGSANLLLRGAGPTLKDFGVSNALADPSIAVFDANPSIPVLIFENDNWDGSDAMKSLFDKLGAFGFKSTKDAAIQKSMPVGRYSVELHATDKVSGVGIVEAYDLNESATCALVNVSARAPVGVGDGVLVAGFVIGGEGSMDVLLRGVGPTLGSYGVDGALKNPVLKVYREGVLIATSNNWGDGQDAAPLAVLMSQLGAFGFAEGSQDACLLLNLPAGAYTAVVSGAGDTTGIGLAEVYQVQ